MWTILVNDGLFAGTLSQQLQIVKIEKQKWVNDNDNW